MRKTSLLALAAVLSSTALVGQRPPGDSGPPGGSEHRPPMSPLVMALDANGDGIIDAAEITNAPAALRKLDKNGDGKLTPDEYRPPRPGGDGREGPGGDPRRGSEGPPPRRGGR